MQTLTMQQIDMTSGGVISRGQAEMIGGLVGGGIGLLFPTGGSVVGGFVGAEVGDFIYSYGSMSSAAAEESSPLYGLTE